MSDAPHARSSITGTRHPRATRFRVALAAVSALTALAALAGCASAAADSAGSVTVDHPGYSRTAAQPSSAGPASSAVLAASSTVSVAGPAGPSVSGSSVSGSSSAGSSSAGTSPSGTSAAGTASAGTPVAESSTPGTARTVQIVVIGDSLTSGFATPGYPWTTPAQQILDRANLPAHIVNSSVSGIGYASAGTAGVTFADLVRQVVTPRTDIVVLFGSDNDSLTATFEQTVVTTVQLAQQLSPRAAMVIVGPPVTPAQDGADLSGLIAALRGAATSTGATFVDASDWFAGNASELLSSDGEHPNAAGEDYLGQKFAALLEPLIRARLAGG